MSEWLKVCDRQDLPAEGQAREFSVAGRTLCVATIAGQPRALDNVCPHRGGPLAEGVVEHGKIICPWHQFEFDLATGEAVHSPTLKALTYTLRLVDDQVMVEI